MKNTTFLISTLLACLLLFGCASNADLNNPENTSDNYVPSDNYIPSSPSLPPQTAKPVKVVEPYKGGPIFIEGDKEFTTTNGVTNGSGTKTDPYIIDLAGWPMDIASADKSKRSVSVGISISETSKYFVIKNCQITDSTFKSENNFGIGISLLYAENGRIENCTISEVHSGIIPDGVTNVVIANSIVQNGYDGIGSSTGGHSSDGLTVLDSTITGNENNGITLIFLHNGRAENNVVNKNGRGIRLSSAADSNVLNNTLADNVWAGIEVDSGNWVGGIDNNTVSYNTVSGTSNGYGIRLGGKHNVVSYNTVNRNIKGILIGGTNIDVLYNTANSNQEYGFYIVSENNTITDNSATSNNMIQEFNTDYDTKIKTPKYYDFCITKTSNVFERNAYGTVSNEWWC